MTPTMSTYRGQHKAAVVADPRKYADGVGCMGMALVNVVAAVQPAGHIAGLSTQHQSVYPIWLRLAHSNMHPIQKMVLVLQMDRTP